MYWTEGKKNGINYCLLTKWQRHSDNGSLDSFTIVKKIIKKRIKRG